jgi:hypothetical protein
MCGSDVEPVTYPDFEAETMLTGVPVGLTATERIPPEIVPWGLPSKYTVAPSTLQYVSIQPFPPPTAVGMIVTRVIVGSVVGWVTIVGTVGGTVVGMVVGSVVGGVTTVGAVVGSVVGGVTMVGTIIVSVGETGPSAAAMGMAAAQTARTMSRIRYLCFKEISSCTRKI